MPPRARGLLCHCLHVTQDAQSTCALTAVCSARLPARQRLLAGTCRGSHESQEGFQLYGAGSWPPGPHLPPTVFQGQVYSQ